MAATPNHCGGLRRVRRCNVVEIVELCSKCGLDLLGIRRGELVFESENSLRPDCQCVENFAPDDFELPVHDGRPFRSLREGRFVT